MRARWLKPEFFTDKKIGPLGMSAALVFAALWCVADDGGAAECEPVLLKGQMFMRWPEITIGVIELALEKLDAAKRIQRYSAGDREFALIHSWVKNQPVHNPSKFRYPRPSQAVSTSNVAGLPQDSGSSEAVVRPSSHPRHPDTQSPQPPNTQTPKSPVPAAGSVPYLEEFEGVFAAYPKRAGGDSKREGYLAFRARIQAGATAAEILDGVRRYAAYCRATDKVGTEYVKQMRTFLGKSRHWLEPWTLPRGASPPAHRIPGADHPSPETAERSKIVEKRDQEYRDAKRDAANSWAKDHPDKLAKLQSTARVNCPLAGEGGDIARKEWILERIAEKISFPDFETWTAGETAAVA